MGLVLLTTALAWFMLWWFSHSEHHVAIYRPELVEMRAVLMGLSFFTMSWVLMTFAMMLPTTLPLLRIFSRMVHRRADSSALVGLVVLGYITAWGVFGVLLYGMSAFTHSLSHESSFASLWSKYGPAVIILTAGLFQFSSLKYQCLEKCRSPLTFVIARWRSRRSWRHAFRLGYSHGIFCVGCCWALMALMFVAGIHALAWMFILGAFMAIEKNARWGQRLTRPVGGILMLWGIFAFIKEFGLLSSSFF